MWEMMEQKLPYIELSNVEVVEVVSNKGYRLPKPSKIECPVEIYNFMVNQCWNQGIVIHDRNIN